MPFNCDKCGLCCTLCDKHVELKKFDRGDGVCKNLKADKTCSIYEIRPDICSVDKSYKKKDLKISLDEYYKISEDACKFIKEHLKSLTNL
jgi:uncharacterized protein